MRNKIDNLILLNLIWIFFVSLGLWIKNYYIFLFCLGGILLTLIYAIFLLKGISKRVEKSSRTRLRKRIVFDVFQSIGIATIIISMISNMNQ